MVGNEGEDDSGHPRRAARCAQRADEAERAVAAEGKGAEGRHAIDCERAQAHSEEREEEERDAVAVLGESECVAIREEDVGVKEMKRIVKGLMIIPPERPSERIRVAV